MYYTDNSFLFTAMRSNADLFQICSDELSALTSEVVSGVESISKSLSKLGEYFKVNPSWLFVG